MATNPNWYKTSYRRNLVDMHIEDWNPEFLSQFKAEDYYANLVKAQVKSAMIYLQSHVGHCNWNTESGHKHASFPNCEKEMQKLFDLCHQGDIDVVVYYSLIYNNDAYIEHPEWRLVDVNGNTTRKDKGLGQYFGGTRYGLCCPNNPEYQKFVLTQLDEIFDRFEFEGIFLDMTFWTRVCHCDACKKRWAEEHGGEIPKTMDWKQPVTMELQRKREEWMYQFCQMVTDKIKSRNPNCAVEHQYSTMMHSWSQGVCRNIAMASDYCGGDFYGGVPQHSIACKLYYNMTLNQPFEYMTSRCYPGLAEHTTTKTDDMLRQSVMATIAHHGAVLLIDAIDPKGTLDPRIYEKYGQLYSEAKLYEKYMEGDMCEDVAVLYNLEAKYDPDNGNGMPHPDAVLGACKIMQRAHIPYGVFGDWRPEKMAGSKVIVLGDAYNLDNDVVDFVKKYVQDGGNLYMSGRTNPELVEALLGVKLEGEYGARMTYMVPTETGKDLFENHNRDFPLAVTGHVQKLPKGDYDAVLATIALPYPVPELPESELTPDPNDGYDYRSKEARFVSIHSNPPGQYLDEAPALILKKVGKGTVIYSAAPFEAFDRPANGPLFIKLIEKLAGKDWSFTATGPSQLELVAFTEAAKGYTYISLVNCIEGFSVPALVDTTVRVKADKPVKQVLALPAETPIDFKQEDGYAVFDVPRVDICSMYRVEY